MFFLIFGVSSIYCLVMSCTDSVCVHSLEFQNGTHTKGMHTDGIHLHYIVLPGFDLLTDIRTQLKMLFWSHENGLLYFQTFSKICPYFVGRYIGQTKNLMSIFISVHICLPGT